jgi:hypothetical protein
VEGCDRVCSRPKKRERHLIDKHQYPKRFNFNIVLSGIVPFSERMRQVKRENALWRSREQGRHRTNQNASHRHQSQSSQDPLAQSEAMEVEVVGTQQTPPHRKNANHHNTSTSSGAPAFTGPSGLPPKKNAFRQYRTPEAKPATRRKHSIVADHDMEADPTPTPAPAPAPVPATSGGGSKADMDIDQLQQSMARLMIPRSVANKMRQQRQ